MDRLLYTPEEAADLLGIGRSRLYDLIRTRDLDSVKIGRSRRISASALTDYVTSLATSLGSGTRG